MIARNLNIGTQLKIGLAVILLCVALFGAIVAMQMESLWQTTLSLYEHPLAVRTAITALTSDIPATYIALSDAVTKDNAAERDACLRHVDARETDARQSIEVLRQRYLGPQKDVDDIVNVLDEARSSRAETLHQLYAGQASQAVARVMPGGIHRIQLDRALSEIDDVSRFASARTDELVKNAERDRDTAIIRLATVAAVLLLLSGGVANVLRNRITVPLRNLTRVTKDIQGGNLDARSQDTSRNEIGLLARSFNAMAGTVQAELHMRQNTADIAEVMLREEIPQTFCHELLKELIYHTGAQIAAIYFLNEADAHYHLFHSIGMENCKAAFSAQAPEGEFALAIATREVQCITDIPRDTPFAFASVGEEFRPREILTVPILAGQRVVAVISLATIRGFSAATKQLIANLMGMMTARINGILVFQQARELSAQLEAHNRELEAQKRELATQKDELSEQNTELEIQKQQLGEANRLKSSFLSNMSHELRTPLNSVIALSSVLARRLEGKVPQEEYGYLNVIERNGKSLLNLINELLDLARIEAGREDVHLACFNMTELISDVVAMLQPQAQLKDLELRNIVADALPPITTDPDKCRHILQNLIANAVKFTDRGSIVVSVQQAADELHISVADTGIGIAPEYLPCIFDEFRQADESTSRRYGGTGLGLTIARKYASLLGGSLGVTSELGKGSEFTLCLPLHESAQLQALGADTPLGSPQEPAADPSPAVAGKRLLVVEDSEPAAIQIVDILHEQGYSVDVARDGAEALAQIEMAVPDAMILDLMMPRVDGFQVLQTVRSVEKTAHLPVLIVTAKHISREELAFLKGNHIHQLIQKGAISKDELLRTIHAMVASLAPITALPACAASRRPIQGKPVILIVEDNHDNMQTTRAMLQDAYSLIEASDGHFGLAQARTHRPHLILLDVSLPGMDGFQVVQELRRDEVLRHVPVIALTARAMKGDRQEIIARGFDGYVSKPVIEAALSATIQELLYGD